MKERTEEQKEREKEKEKKPKDDQPPRPRPLHRTCSLFMRSIAPTISKAEIVAVSVHAKHCRFLLLLSMKCCLNAAVFVFVGSCVDVIQDLCVFVCQNRSQSAGMLKLDSLQFQHFRAGDIAEILI